MTVVAPSGVQAFLRGKSIKDLHGIGPKTVEMLAEQGVKNIPQLAQVPVVQLQEWFGSNKGPLIHEKALGIDESEVKEREKQQYSRIKTLKENASRPEKLLEESEQLAKELSAKVKEHGVQFKTVSVIVISDKLETITRSRTLEIGSQRQEDILSVAKELFEQFFSEHTSFVARRFGLRVSNFEEPRKQKSIFEY